MITKLVNTVSSVVNEIRDYFGLPKQHTGEVEYDTYVSWRDKYYDLHKNTLTEAKEKLGLAFCQEYKLRDMELSHCTNRIQAEALIFARYVPRSRTLYQL